MQHRQRRALDIRAINHGLWREIITLEYKKERNNSWKPERHRCDAALLSLQDVIYGFVKGRYESGVALRKKFRNKKRKSLFRREVAQPTSLHERKSYKAFFNSEAAVLSRPIISRKSN